MLNNIKIDLVVDKLPVLGDGTIVVIEFGAEKMNH